METKSENLTRGKKINPNVGPENPVPSVPPGGNHSYNDPTPEEIPIICMGGFDTDEEDSIIKTQSEEKMIEFMKEELNEIRECGFNCFIRLVFSDASDFNHVMDLLSIKNDLTAIANFRSRKKDEKDGSWETISEYLNYVNSFLKNIKQYHVKGFLLGDEPKYADLENFWKPIYEEIYSRLHSQVLLANKMLFLNLAADTASEWIGSSNNENYLKYLRDTIQKMFKPPVWSYDLYPCYYDKGTVRIKASFYPRLIDFAQISKETDRPFYAFAQCMKYKIKSNGYETAVPTLPRMRFECFSALAMGAQGIIFWRFRLQRDNKDEEYSDAPITLDGKRNPGVWNAVHDVISEIKKFSYIFYQSSLEDYKILDFGNYKISFGPLINVSSTGKFLMTLLKNGSYNYLIVVNGTSEISIKMSLTFKDKFNFIEIYPVNPQLPPELNDSNKSETLKELDLSITLDRTLSGGGYLIYRWVG